MLCILDWILRWTLRLFGKCGGWFLKEARYASPDHLIFGQHLMQHLPHHVNTVFCCSETVLNAKGLCCPGLDFRYLCKLVGSLNSVTHVSGGQIFSTVLVTSFPWRVLVGSHVICLVRMKLSHVNDSLMSSGKVLCCCGVQWDQHS